METTVFHTASTSAANTAATAGHDHRRLGRELDLFDTDPLIGAGLPYWLPAGAAVRHTLEEYIREGRAPGGLPPRLLARPRQAPSAPPGGRHPVKPWPWRSRRVSRLFRRPPAKQAIAT
ncbi:hypothetical protein N5079_22800 [Planotetraspora sp. A-T 1434]|uniref:hypothetical protein n=1 Tax=Planotetraspora sp. A-T 1434 TaxID=2979219 RepID=UPI0021BF1549|nr:hypothetical protein [Planotetraspora sp. A-T 1434]MCT9933042.1 hypothetical protein [Planotetraspora sp. A-T 1434]